MYNIKVYQLIKKNSVNINSFVFHFVCTLYMIFIPSFRAQPYDQLVLNKQNKTKFHKRVDFFMQCHS